ncbi:MAG: endonuclease/exonuclease/phosphatase family protein [Planctomycetota bacterium]|nr:endonuclease/exonuclease/phosphatase family protein [Planctomycetota bacterium]
MNTRLKTWRGLSVALVGVLLAAGCQTAQPVAEAPTLRTHGVILDGDISEWPSEVAAFADEHYLYVRFTVEGQQFSLQSAPNSVVVSIDADASPSTGRVDAEGPLAGMGVDAEIEFSPRRPDGSAGRGVAVWTVHADGRRESVAPGATDVVVAPTYASSWYELRISRTPDVPMYPASAGLAGTGLARVAVCLRAPDGRVTAWADPCEAAIEDVCAGGKRLSSLSPPTAPRNGVRVVSWNVERSAPASNPEPFGRILRALSPDVVLIQEWDQGDEASVRAWLEAAGFPGWTVHKAPGDLGEGGGVLVASRFPLERVPGPLRMNDGERDSTVRVAAAIVRTPLGDMLASSMHLKCCGYKDSREDRQRMAEARAINEFLRGQVRTRTGGDRASESEGRLVGPRVIGGDINLVGSRPPLDLLRSGLDVDGTDLDVADARVLGDRTYTTWRDPGTPFPPGRLDFLMYSDSACESVSFVFDSARLTDAALEPLGVRRDDSAASDHLPVVLDLTPVR